jgi:ubiquinone/menaquinone biosynthesis C-methylase UbiE
MGHDYEHWVRNADDWIAWARAPNHDAFWAYRGQLLDFIGTGEGNALEVGCGEGRVSRAIKECGYRVTAADPVEAFVAAAREAESADDYRIAAVTSLPFEDHSFDLAVAYNVLMDVDDIPGAMKEITRPRSASLRHVHCIRCASFH